MIYITGDTHGEFYRIEEFCKEYETTTDDIMIILGDAGVNYWLNDRDTRLKNELLELPITLFCIHGNHEERPYMIDTYEEKEWNGGMVYWEADYPNILFAKDGEIYDLGGKKCIAIGGAYSIDKDYRLRVGAPWYETEQPSNEIKNYVEAQLDKVDWQVDCVLSHTTPLPYEPRWAFLPGYNQDAIDKSTENWLAWIEENLSYDSWYAGHFHVDSDEGPIHLMYTEIEEFE